MSSTYWIVFLTIAAAIGSSLPQELQLSNWDRLGIVGILCMLGAGAIYTTHRERKQFEQKIADLPNQFIDKMTANVVGHGTADGAVTYHKKDKP